MDFGFYRPFGRAASRGALAPDPPLSTRSQPDPIRTVSKTIGIRANQQYFHQPYPHCTALRPDVRPDVQKKKKSALWLIASGAQLLQG